MQLFYGDVEFTIVNLRSMQRTSKFTQDDTTYLWTHWIIDAAVVYNPTATSYTVGDPGNFDTGDESPTFLPTTAAITDSSILHHLSQPRRTLRILDDSGNIILLSPATGKTVDQTGGPKITVQSTETIHGDKTFVINLRIETDLNDCHDDNFNGHFLLSHRWARNSDVDEDRLTTIVTEGTCVFNLAELTASVLEADQFRVFLVHPVPDNFQRVNIQVFPSKDGYTYNYRTVDQERMFNIGDNCPATRIQAYHTAGFSKMNPLAATPKHAPAIAEATGQLATIDAGLAGGKLVAIGIKFAQDILPQYHATCSARLWGARTATRDALRNLGIGIVNYRLRRAGFNIGVQVEAFGVPINIDLPGITNNVVSTDELMISEDVMGRFVEVQKTVRWGIENILTLGIGGNRSPTQFVVHQFNNDPNVSDALKFGQLRNPAYVRNAYGTALEKLIAQSLSVPCALPRTQPTQQQLSDQVQVPGALS